MSAGDQLEDEAGSPSSFNVRKLVARYNEIEHGPAAASRASKLNVKSSTETNWAEQPSTESNPDVTSLSPKRDKHDEAGHLDAQTVQEEDGSSFVTNFHDAASIPTMEFGSRLRPLEHDNEPSLSQSIITGHQSKIVDDELRPADDDESVSSATEGSYGSHRISSTHHLLTHAAGDDFHAELAPPLDKVIKAQESPPATKYHDLFSPSAIPETSSAVLSSEPAVPTVASVFGAEYSVSVWESVLVKRLGKILVLLRNNDLLEIGTDKTANPKIAADVAKFFLPEPPKVQADKSATPKVATLSSLSPSSTEMDLCPLGISHLTLSLVKFLFKYTDVPVTKPWFDRLLSDPQGTEMKELHAHLEKDGVRQKLETIYQERRNNTSWTAKLSKDTLRIKATKTRRKILHPSLYRQRKALWHAVLESEETDQTDSTQGGYEIHPCPGLVDVALGETGLSASRQMLTNGQHVEQTVEEGSLILNVGDESFWTQHSVMLHGLLTDAKAYLSSLDLNGHQYTARFGKLIDATDTLESTDLPTDRRSGIEYASAVIGCAEACYRLAMENGSCARIGVGGVQNRAVMRKPLEPLELVQYEREPAVIRSRKTPISHTDLTGRPLIPFPSLHDSVHKSGDAPLSPASSRGIEMDLLEKNVEEICGTTSQESFNSPMSQSTFSTTRILPHSMSTRRSELRGFDSLTGWNTIMEDEEEYAPGEEIGDQVAALVQDSLNKRRKRERQMEDRDLTLSNVESNFGLVSSAEHQFSDKGHVADGGERHGMAGDQFSDRHHSSNAKRPMSMFEHAAHDQHTSVPDGKQSSSSLQTKMGEAMEDLGTGGRKPQLVRNEDDSHVWV